MGHEDDKMGPPSPDSLGATTAGSPSPAKRETSQGVWSMSGGGLPYEPEVAPPRSGAQRGAGPSPHEGICIPPVMVASVAIAVLAAGFFIGFSAGAVGLPTGPTDAERLATLEAQLAGTLAHIERIEGGISELYSEKLAVVPFNTTAQPRGLLTRLGKGGGSALILALIGALAALIMLSGKSADAAGGGKAGAELSTGADNRIRELSAAVQLVESTLNKKVDSSSNTERKKVVDSRLQELSLAVQKVETTMGGKVYGEGSTRKQEVDTHLRKLDAAVHIIRSSLNKKADTSEVAESVQRSVCGGVTRVEWSLANKDFEKCKLGDEIKSPEFTMGCIHGLDLRFYPRGVKHGSATHCALFLGAPKNTRLKCRLSVDGASSREGEHDYQKGLAFFGVVEFGPVKPAYSSVAVELVSGHQEREIPETGEKLIHRFEVPSVKTTPA